MKGNVIKTVLLCACLLCASACTSQSDNTAVQNSEAASSASDVSEQSTTNEDSPESSEESAESSEEESSESVSSEDESSETESSEKESSAPAEPAFSKDEIIDLLLKNENVWTENAVSHAKEGNVGTSIRFCDIDGDGSCEFLTFISQGSGLYTTNYIYTVKDGELVCAGSFIGGNFELYKYESTPVLISYETNKSGVSDYIESCYRYQYKDASLSGSIVAYAVHTLSPETGSDYATYYVTEEDTAARPEEIDTSIREEVTEAGYEGSIENAKYDCEEVKFESEKYSGYDWLGLSDDQKKQTLSGLYDSFKLS